MTEGNKHVNANLNVTFFLFWPVFQERKIQSFLVLWKTFHSSIKVERTIFSIHPVKDRLMSEILWNIKNKVFKISIPVDVSILTNTWWSIHVWCHFVYLWKIRIKTINKPSFAIISVKRKAKWSVFWVLCSLLYRSFFFSKWFEIKCLEAKLFCEFLT